MSSGRPLIRRPGGGGKGKRNSSRGGGLSIGEPGDQYEEEADAVADHVVNGTAEAPSAMATPAASGNVQLMRSPAGEELQMQPAEEERVQMMPEEEIQAKGDEELQMQPEEELQAKEEEEVQMKASSAGAPAVQRSADGGKTASPQASSSIKATKGQGSRLPGPVNAEMSCKIGADFSDVKVHTDSRAAQLSADLGAQAFATGKDIYFAKGKFNPGSREGKHLLAHELAHVVQQGKAGELIQKQDEPSAAQVIRDNFVRRIARFPYQAHTRWHGLSKGEQVALITYMTAYYGINFSRMFREYTRHPELVQHRVELTNNPGVTPQGYPRLLEESNFRFAGLEGMGVETWVHPSGREIWLVRTRRRPEQPENSGANCELAQQLRSLGMPFSPGICSE